MSFRHIASIVVPGLALTGFGLHLWAQPPEGFKPLTRKTEWHVAGAGSNEQTSEHRTRVALEKHHSAESDAGRNLAEQELRAALDEQFEQWMRQREEQLADLRSRLDKLTEQTRKRRDAKQQIIDLRVQVLLNEAQGLGFYPEAGSARFDGGGPLASPSNPFNSLEPSRKTELP